MTSLEVIQKKLSDEVSKYDTNQKNYQKHLVDRQQSDAQLQENKTVHEELKLLKDNAKVYKLIGPALIKQDLFEALKTVSERINFIEGKIKTVDATLKDLEKEQDQQRESITKLEQQLKQAQMKAMK